MATYNRAGLISKTIQSLLDQTFKDWELVVPDDGSKDSTPEVVKEWEKKITSNNFYSKQSESWYLQKLQLRIKSCQR